MIKKFLTLVAVTILWCCNLMADSVLAINDLEAAQGGQVVLPVIMNNTDNITALSFELHLPEGVTVAKNPSNKYIVEHTERADDQTLSTNLDEGIYYIATLSLSSSTYSGNDGAVLNVTLDVAETVTIGDKTIEIKNIILGTPSTEKIKPANISCKLTVKDQANLYDEGYSLQTSPFIMDEDGEYEMSVTMDNADAVKSIEFDIALPEGLYIDGEDGEYFVDLGSRVTTSTVRNQFSGSVEENTDGSFHVLAKFSRTTSSYIFTGNSGEVLVFPMFADGLQEGLNEIEFRNIVLNGDLKVAPYKASILVGNPTLSGDVKLYGKYTSDEYAMIEKVVANDGASVTCEDVVLADGKCFMTTNNFVAENISYNAAVSPTLGYRTIVLPYSVDVPAEFEAYTVNSVVNNELNMTQVNTIPENTPAILKNAGTAVINANNVTVVATADANLSNGELVGTYSEMNAPVGSYVLQNQGGNVAFYNVQSTQPKVPAFRAYIKSQASGARFMNIMTDGQATGIMNVESGEMMDVKSIHTVDGVRRSALGNGINIVRTENGVKKVIINN